MKQKIKEVLVKPTAAKSSSFFFWAALVVAIAAQKPFEEFINFKHKPAFTQAVKELPRQIAVTMRDSVKSLAKTKMGKGLMIGAAATSILGIWNASKNFKAPKENKQSTVDYNKQYMEF